MIFFENNGKLEKFFESIESSTVNSNYEVLIDLINQNGKSVEYFGSQLKNLQLVNSESVKFEKDFCLFSKGDPLINSQNFQLNKFSLRELNCIIASPCELPIFVKVCIEGDFEYWKQSLDYRLKKHKRKFAFLNGIQDWERAREEEFLKMLKADKA
jgi:hypothetical protein